MFRDSAAQSIRKSGRLRQISIVLAGLCALLVALVGEVMLDIHFEGEDFYTALFLPEGHELGTRLILLFIFIVFIGYILLLWERRSHLEQELSDALRATEEEKAKSKAILDVIGDAISIQDTDYRILYQNQAHQTMMGNRHGELCYKAYQNRQEICPGCHLQLAFADGKIHSREATCISDNRLCHVEILATPLHNTDGEIVAGIESVRNITPRKEAEQRILQLNADLEKKTAELSSLNRELETFNAALSHDLKTPLSINLGATELLSDLYSQHLDSTGQELLGQILRSAERMEELIEAMLLFAQHSKGALQPEETDLSAMAAEIAAGLHQKELSRQIDWQIEPGLVANVDPRLFRSVLENLLGNAWKYTARSNAAVIRFGRNSAGTMSEFYVRDNGCGFDMAQADRIFRPFQRLHTADEYKGNGIGLATVQQIVERHGGRIRAESSPGSGAAFYFSC